MMWSRYAKVYPEPDASGDCLLFSTRTTAVIRVPGALIQAVERGEIQGEEADLLAKLGFLVPDAEAERRAVAALPEEVPRRAKALRATVIMNLDCNLACKYCFEAGVKGHLYMSEKTADDLVDFLTARLPGKELLKIVFYGGEPLLSFGLVHSLAQRLKTAAEAHGVTFRFRLMTNGTLFTAQRARDLVPLGLEGVKFTLDGPKDVHDRLRPLKAGGGSFEAILRNLKATCDLTRLVVGGNFSKEDYRRFPELLDVFLAEGLTPDRISMVRFDPIQQTRQGCSFEDCITGCTGITDPWLFDAACYLREEILKRGFYTPKVAPSLCMVEYPDDWVVNFDGSLYKCPTLMNWEQLKVGDLVAGVGDYQDLYGRDRWKREACLSCEYLPLCFGGCRYSVMLRNGAIDDVDCKRAFFDACLEKFIRIDLKYRKGPAPGQSVRGQQT